MEVYRLTVTVYGIQNHEETRQETDLEVEPPQMYRVILHNDHYTAMDFVVYILETVFRKPADEAVRIMLNVHENGTGTAGVYTAEIAEAKVAAVHRQARQHGYPLRCSMEPE